ncbi:hypothetical protein R1flu_012949 [Riccia fluitans]|uniref:Uncharacterized protein n=1 Tax=Riccia fluitans TaxID=41844 RepID=A0ABD1ZG60_9MARC
MSGDTLSSVLGWELTRRSFDKISDIVVLRSADNEDEYIDAKEVSNENEGPATEEVDRDAGIGDVNEEPNPYIPDWGDSEEDLPNDDTEDEYYGDSGSHQSASSDAIDNLRDCVERAELLIQRLEKKEFGLAVLFMPVIVVLLLLIGTMFDTMLAILLR